MDVFSKELIIYETSEGRTPFLDWFYRLKDSMVTARIKARLARLHQGNFGDFKSVGDGVYELRLPFGKGYRIYYSQHQKQIIILLMGGDKQTQSKDIKLAKQYWLDCQERIKGDEKKKTKNWKIF